MEMEYDLIFISSILIIILICLYVKKCKNKQIEPFLPKQKGKKKNKFAEFLAKKLGNKLQTPQCPKCPDCNCPSIQISKTVSGNAKLQKLLDIYVQEGLDKIIQNEKWDNTNIENGDQANEELKLSINELSQIVSTLSDYHTDAQNTLDELLDFNDQNVAVIKSDVDETKDIKVVFSGAVKEEIVRFVSKINLLSLIIKNMKFYNKFLSNVVSQ